MPAFRVLVVAASLTFLAACQQAKSIALPWETPTIPPAEEALAAQCTGDATLAAQVDAAVNAAREAQGKTPLKTAPALSLIAQSHACDMARTGRLDVEGSNGSSVVDRARAANYPVCGAVQLVGRGGGPGDAVARWMGAEAQRTELLGQSSHELGSGTAIGADGQTYYSVVLGDNCR